MASGTKFFLILGVAGLIGSSVYAAPYINGRFFLSKTSSEEKSDQLVVQSDVINRHVDVNDAVVSSSDERTLSFLASGRVKEISAVEGSIVDGGTPLMRLDTSALEFQKKSLEANLSGAEALLAKLRAGADDAEIGVVVSKVGSAKKSVSDLKKIMISTLRSGYTRGDDAVRGKTNQFFTDPDGSDPQLVFSMSDPGLEADIEEKKADLQDTLESWDDRIDGLNSNKDFNKEVDKTEDFLDDVEEYLDMVSEAINGLSTGGSLTDETLAAWKESVSFGRVEVDEAKVDARNALYTLNAAINEHTVSDKELNVIKSSPRNEDVSVLQSNIEDLKNKISLIDVGMRDALISAPVQGKVLKLHLKEGETVAEGQPAISFSRLQQRIDADVPEEKISLVQVGDDVDISTANILGLEMKGSVDFIEPKAIEKDGDTYYRARIVLQGYSQELLPGMTVKVKISSKKQHRTIRVPIAYVIRRGTQDFITVRRNETDQKVGVTLGEVEDGFVEVISGINENDIIVVNE